MLSPCTTKTADGKEEKRFVIVELCEDIRIDTAQLANFEFFSGAFKDFTISIAKTYPGRAGMGYGRAVLAYRCVIANYFALWFQMADTS